TLETSVKRVFSPPSKRIGERLAGDPRRQIARSEAACRSGTVRLLPGRARRTIEVFQAQALRRGNSGGCLAGDRRTLAPCRDGQTRSSARRAASSAQSCVISESRNVAERTITVPPGRVGQTPRRSR